MILSKDVSMKQRDDILDKSNAKRPFQVPEGYFDSLTDQVISNLADEPYQQPMPAVGFDRAKPYLYLVAMFVGLYLVVSVLMDNTNSQSELVDRSTYIVNDIEAEYQLSQLSEYEIYEVLNN